MSTVSSVCQKIIRIDEYGIPVKKDKQKYNTLTEAIAVAKKINANTTQFHKVNAYKCTKCNKYHVGKGKKTLEKVPTTAPNHKPFADVTFDDMEDFIKHLGIKQ